MERKSLLLHDFLKCIYLPFYKQGASVLGRRGKQTCHQFPFTVQFIHRIIFIIIIIKALLNYTHKNCKILHKFPDENKKDKKRKKILKMPGQP